MKSVLIISPHFPPINAADMHRVRQSVAYFEDFGWKQTVVTVDESYVEAATEILLSFSLPKKLAIIKVKAFSSTWTRKIGLGALALRSLLFYFFAVNKFLKKEKADLIFFSTTQFPLLILGRYWKWRFKVPYIIDMQDPWHSTYYLDKPKNERPQKFWFSYYLNKCLEPIAMNNCDGLISVSQAYIAQLHARYPILKSKPNRVITFGAYKKDMELTGNVNISSHFFYDSTLRYIVYVGRGGYDMQPALSIVFDVFKKGLSEQSELFESFRFLFVGTSYAPMGKGIKTILPVAEKAGIGKYVEEFTDRVPYFEGLSILQRADLLLIPGSDDPAYTASKLYPYILTKKPILVLFHPKSSAISILKETNSASVCNLNDTTEIIYKSLTELLEKVNEGSYENKTNWEAFEKYTAKEMTRRQVEVFEEVIQMRYEL